MVKFPVDAPTRKVIRALESLGFRLVREGNHIAMVRENPDGTRTPLTMPNHRRIKGATLRTILRQSGISRDEFLEAYRDA
jgi:predicted RNA binding protein YcfA (HicA-like mRNA interferase family)